MVVVVAVTGGKPEKGPWEQIFCAEYDDGYWSHMWCSPYPCILYTPIKDDSAQLHLIKNTVTSKSQAGWADKYILRNNRLMVDKNCDII